MSEGKQLLLAMGGWVAYLVLVYFSCTFLYFKIEGKPPKNPQDPVNYHGNIMPAGLAWEKRTLRTRRVFIGIGTGLVLFPLLAPIFFRLFF